MRKVKAKKLRKIHTVYNVIEYRKIFDIEVNEYILKGWRVGEFRLIEGTNHDYLYARLELWE